MFKMASCPHSQSCNNQDVILSVIDCWEHLKAAGCTWGRIKVHWTKKFFVSQLQKHTTRAGSGTNSKHKSTVCSNGFSKRIFEASFASITPYLRQASMKRAVRSNCLILFPRQTRGESNRDKEVSGVCTKSCQSPSCLCPLTLHKTTSLMLSALCEPWRSLSMRGHKKTLGSYLWSISPTL